jgi:uncharacterized Ntn-hydrolase superfamily protein
MPFATRFAQRAAAGGGFKPPRRLLAALLLSTAPLAGATWSIVAVDPQTQEVGVAGASCTEFVFGIAGLAPGKGAIAAQAFSNMNAKRQALRLLQQGQGPRAVVDAITDAAFDATQSLQQYGVVALGFEPAVAQHTGSNTNGWQGSLKGPHVAVQGNLLTGPEVLDDAYRAFNDEAARTGSRLADRLLAALEAGAARGGDLRCGAQRARSAFLLVAKPDDDARLPTVRLNITGSEAEGGNPLPLLRRAYDRERSRH